MIKESTISNVQILDNETSVDYRKMAVSAIISVMRNGDGRIRSFAARVLGIMRAAEASEDLTGYLNDPDPDIRCDVISALGSIRDKGALLELHKALQDEDGQVRIIAIQSIAEFADTSSAVPLINVMTSKEEFFYDLGGDLSGNYRWEIQEKAAHALGRINDHRSVQALLDILKDDDAEYMLGAILQSLIKLGDRKGIEAAAGYLNDPDVAKRRKAARSFCYSKDNSVLEFIIEALVDEDNIVKINALEAIENIAGEKDIIPVVLLLKDNDSDVRAKTIEVIARVGGEKAAKHITPLLCDPASSVRKKAAEILGNLGGKESVEPLIRLLQDNDEGVAAEVILSLGKIGDRSGISPLIAALKDKKMIIALRSRAIFSLIRISAEEGFQAATDILADKVEDKELRLMALRSLKDYDKQQSEAVLLPLLNDEADAVKKEAAIFLSNNGNDSGFDIMVSSLNDKDCNCIAEAFNAIKNIKSERAIAALFDGLKSKDVNMRCGAAIAICEAGDKDAVESVIEMLKDEKKEVRRAAIIGLGRLCDKRAIRHFVASLFDYELFDDLRYEIAISLKKIDIDESTILLLNVLSNKSESRNNHWTAMEALSVIHGAENSSSV
jgi:HEAT repeat protein